SPEPVANQMVVLEQFKAMPMVLFTSRYNEVMRGGGFQKWMAATLSIEKRTGKRVYAPDPRQYNNGPQFYAFNGDLKAGTIELIAQQLVVQHYLDDGRGPPPDDGPKGTDRPRFERPPRDLPPGGGPGGAQPVPAFRRLPIRR